MTKVAVYARVSTAGQEERHTIDAQLHECRRYAERNGLEIVEEFTDEGVSGTLPFEERSAGRRLLEAAEAKRFEKTLIYCIDRLARDMGEGVDAYRKLRKVKAPAEFVLQSFDGLTPEGELMFNTFMSFAQYELSAIRRRTMQGRAKKVRVDGVYTSPRVPFGYDRDEARRLVINEQQAAIIRDVFHMAAVENLGLHAIAARLNAADVTFSDHPGKYGVGITTLSKLLNHPRYVGRAVYGETQQEMTCPPIVDERTFAAAKKGLAQRRKESQRSTKAEYLLQHKVVCGVCGSTYAAQTSASGKQSYACRERRVHGKAAGHEGSRWWWRAEVLETVVKKVIQAMLADPETAANTMEVYCEQLAQQAQAIEDEAAPLRAKLDSLATQDERLLDGWTRGVITERDMVKQRATLRTEREALDDRLRALEAASSPVDAKRVLEETAWAWRELAGTTRYLGRAAAAEDVGVRLEWNEPTDVEWRELVRFFIKKVVVQPNGKLDITGVLTSVNPATRTPLPQSVLANPQS